MMDDRYDQWSPLEGRLAPWSMPVPVRSSGFVPLYSEHEPLAVETNLGAIASFSVSSDEEVYACAHADFQLLADYPAHRRLGSGRAVFYRGKYLKGVGRTPLAANWGEVEDTWHGSGHMHASAAIREIVVSRYLQAKGLGHTIVSCEGLLLRRMPDGFRHAFRAYAARSNLVLAPIDYELQAITVKPGGFARWSNFLWLLVNAPAMARYVIEFGWLLDTFAQGPHGRPPAANECTPKSIVRSMAQAMDRARSNFEAYFHAGIFWGSFCNNSTLDGRFLDLEVPTILGEGRFFGIVPCAPGPSVEHTQHALVLGEEVLGCARQLRAVVVQFRRRLLELAERTTVAQVREFIAAIVDELSSTFDADHWIHSRTRQRELMKRLYEAAEGPDQLERAIDSLIDQSHRVPTRLAVDWRRTPLCLAPPEPTLRMAIYVPAERSFADEGPAAVERRVVNDAIVELEALASVDEVLAGLRQHLARIDQVVRPIPTGGAAWTSEPMCYARTAT